MPWRHTSIYWHESVPGYVAVVSYWGHPWRELMDDQRRLRRGEDPIDHNTHRPCRVRLRPRHFTHRPRVRQPVHLVHGLVPARRFARALLATMADLAEPAILASARVDEGTAPLTGGARLPAHYMDFLRPDLTLPPATCGCNRPCHCATALGGTSRHRKAP